jgi:hypothetical protein
MPDLRGTPDPYWTAQISLRRCESNIAPWPRPDFRTAGWDTTRLWPEEMDSTDSLVLSSRPNSECAPKQRTNVRRRPRPRAPQRRNLPHPLRQRLAMLHVIGQLQPGPALLTRVHVSFPLMRSHPSRSESRTLSDEAISRLNRLRASGSEARLAQIPTQRMFQCDHRGHHTRLAPFASLRLSMGDGIARPDSAGSTQ